MTGGKKLDFNVDMIFLQNALMSTRRQSETK